MVPFFVASYISTIYLITLTNAQVSEELIGFYNFNGSDPWYIWQNPNPNRIYYLDDSIGNCLSLAQSSCLNIRGGASVYEHISISGYHSIRLVIDVREVGLENNEWCYLEYETPSKYTANLATLNDETWLGQSIMVSPTANGRDNILVRIGNDADTDSDNCYFDNLRVYGIPYTLSPTISTKHPTNTPFISPTNPSISPSNSPSDIPTHSPSISPSFQPSILPSMSPSNMPSISQSSQPSKTPTIPKTGQVGDSPSTSVPINAGEDAEGSPENSLTFVYIAGSAVVVIVSIVCIVFALIKIKNRKLTVELETNMDSGSNIPDIRHAQETNNVIVTEESVEAMYDNGDTVTVGNDDGVQIVTPNGDTLTEGQHNTVDNGDEDNDDMYENETGHQPDIMTPKTPTETIGEPTDV